MVATVSAVASASGATRYYEKDGYYAKDDPEHKKGSFWYGKASEELGLSKQVEGVTSNMRYISRIVPCLWLSICYTDLRGCYVKRKVKAGECSSKKYKSIKTSN